MVEYADRGKTAHTVDSPAACATPTVGGDGAVYVRDLTLPPSELWSPEFKAFHIRLLADTAAAARSSNVPARTAAKAEWDKYDARQEAGYAEHLNLALQLYPVTVADTHVAGVRVGIVTPRDGIDERNRDAVLINLRGGGFVYNRGLSVGLLESVPVCALGRIKVITIDYRQAPFHQYPAASEDVAAVYQALLKEHCSQRVGIFGSSAGGALTAQSLARFQASGLPLPAAAGIFSIAPPPPCVPAPWQQGWGDSVVWFSRLAPANEPPLADRAAWEPASWYMQGVDLQDPIAYPGSSDAVLADFPPILLLSGTRDFAVSSVVRAHARLVRLGVSASLYVIEGGSHGAHIFALGTPEAHDAQSYIARWFCEHLSG